MKTLQIFLILVCLVMVNEISFAQDKIHLKDGKIIEAKILEVNEIEIKYKEPNNNLSPIYVVKQEFVLMYKLADPDSKIFKTNDVSNNVAYVKDPKTPENNINSSPLPDMYNKGTKDAAMYYDQYKGASTSTLIIGLLSPLAGLVPAIACSSTRPKTENLGYPSPFRK
jgi:hypothetical protein